MQNCMNEFPLVGKFYSLDGPPGIADKSVITGAFFFLPVDAPRISVLVYCPHRIGIETRCNIEVVARFRQMSGVFGCARLLFAARCHPGEFTRDVNEFLNSSTNFLKIGLNARPAIAENFTSPSLVPIYAASLNHLIEYPALLAPAFGFPFSFNSHRSPDTDKDNESSNDKLDKPGRHALVLLQ